MITRHEHPSLDLEGIWDYRSCKFTVMFPVVQVESEDDILVSESKRVRDLRQRAGSLLSSPVVKMESYNTPTATPELPRQIDLSMQILEEEFTYPSSGLMIVMGRYFKPKENGKSDLEQCVNLVADVFSDRMFERTHGDSAAA